MILGKWNPSVYLTYAGVGIIVMGLFFLQRGQIHCAVLSLIWAGVADLFDGTVARRIKRNDEEKAFGIQLDTVADVVSFAIFPVALLLAQGFARPWYWPIFAIYVIAALARLSAFTVAAQESPGPKRCYRGLPVTSAAIILPSVFIFSRVLPYPAYEALSVAVKGLTGLAFILDFPVPKPYLRGACILVALALAMTGLILWIF